MAAGSAGEAGDGADGGGGDLRREVQVEAVQGVGGRVVVGVAVFGGVGDQQRAAARVPVGHVVAAQHDLHRLGGHDQGKRRQVRRGGGGERVGEAGRGGVGDEGDEVADRRRVEQERR